MNCPFNINFVWFVLIGILASGYVILDGFDLGVGALHLFSKGDTERRTLINAIGPVWDGNEVWLVTSGGALFAAFPNVYATLASGFYLAVFLLLFSLIFRAIAIEFRSKEPMGWWRQMWDISFSVSSIITSILLGVVVGNLIWGVPLTKNGEFAGTFLGLLNPYALLIGITTLALFMMHGAIYTVLKTEGELHDKARRWAVNAIIFFVICFLTATMVTLVYVPGMAQHMRDYPVFFLVPILNMLAIANIPREFIRGEDFKAFLSSCASMLAFIFLFGVGVFPHLVTSNPNPEYSLTIYNAASSHKTLHIMLIIALIGMPFVLAYTASIYWVFRGKVKLSDMSY